MEWQLGALWCILRFMREYLLSTRPRRALLAILGALTVGIIGQSVGVDRGQSVAEAITVMILMVPFIFRDVDWAATRIGRRIEGWFARHRLPDDPSSQRLGRVLSRVGVVAAYIFFGSFVVWWVEEDWTGASRVIVNVTLIVAGVVLVGTMATLPMISSRRRREQDAGKPSRD